MNKILIAVYGSLRKEMGNHRLLENANYLGEFDTTPNFSLYSLGGYPGLKQDGETSVKMEVYEVTPEEARRVDNLEGYTPGASDNNFYDKIQIETPYGWAGTYVFVPSITGRTLVKSGDWKEFRMEKSSTY